MTSLHIGDMLQNGKYKIAKVLGQGGFGITYLAIHTLLDKKVAIKEFFPKDFCDRDSDTNHITLGTASSSKLVAKLRLKFVKETKNIAKLSHPNIVPIQDIFEENNTAYYIMDYIDGQSLADMLKSSGAFTQHKALHYIRHVASAIGYMHSRSMNHFDIKPGNIMVRKSDDMPVLIDFGTSKQYDNEGEQTSTMAPGFTHGYAPIEQYKPGGVATFTPQTDIYALGATLYALITGKKPPHYSEILEDGLPPLGDNISPDVAGGIRHAMEVKKINRPATIGEFMAHFPTVEPNDIAVQPDLGIRREDDTIIAEVQETSPATIDWNEFVDLGLSVLWAKTNFGAIHEAAPGIFVDKTDSNTMRKIRGLEMTGASVPTIAQFEELKNECHWELTERGYIVKGKNGNKIFLPFSGNEFSTGPDACPSTLFTRESFHNNTNGRHYYFYFSPTGQRKSQNYAIDFVCPIRLIRKK